MWSRQLFIVCFFALTILASQSHVIHKRGLISRLFGKNSKSTQDAEGDLSPRERSRFRELMKNPVVVTMLSAAVGMAVQKALQARDMDDVCNNKYVKMAHAAGNLNPQIQQVINLLGCNAPNRRQGSSTVPGKGFSTTTPGFFDDETKQPEETDNQEEEQDGNLESSLPPEKESQIKQLLSIFRGEKGAKRNFLRGLFGMKKKDYGFKQGQKLPSSSYKLDKDDAKSLKDLEKELEQYNKSLP